MMITRALFAISCVAIATSSDVDSALRLAARAEKAYSGELPYQVSLQFGGRHFCGGALISKTHVLTAGHCVADFVSRPYMARGIKVQVGSVKIGGGKLHMVKRVSHAKNYDPDPYLPEFIRGDVAVLTLQTPIRETDNVGVISLPTESSELPVGAKVIVSGFGNARVGGPVSKNLQKTEVFIVSRRECNRYYTRYFQKTIEAAHVCAKRGLGYGACQGDSGGPMVYNDEVIGIVSGGDGDCGAGNPDVYTRVSSHLDYIYSELSYNFDQPEKSKGLAKAINVGESGSSSDRWPSSFPPFFPGFDDFFD